MCGELKTIRKLGAELVIVGNGRPEHAVDFRESHRIECPLLVDPDMKAYAAAGLKRGLASSLSPKVFLHGIRALRAGKMQGETQGDPWQQGGVFVLGPGNKVHFAHVSEEAGDHPAPALILNVLREQMDSGRRMKGGTADAKGKRKK